MKRSHLIAIVLIASAIAIIISTAGDASSYVTFGEAYEMSQSGNSNSIHVVGELTKTGSGEVTGIYPSPNKLSFRFIMQDESGKQQEVFYNEPVPADFKRSEKVVVIGSYNGELFVADKILMKCPSKYQEETVNAGM